MGNVNLKNLPNLFVQTEKNYEKKFNDEVTTSLFNSYEFSNILSKYNLHMLRDQEDDLMKKVREQREKQPDRKLEPQDLYGMALELCDGNRIKAIITVHNAIKMTGRAEEAESSEHEIFGIKNLVGDKFYTQYVKEHGGKYDQDMASDMGEAYLSETLAPINGEKDYTGNYYHMFGTMAVRETGVIGTLSTYVHALSVKLKAYKNGTNSEYTKWEADKAGLEIAKELKDKNKARWE